MKLTRREILELVGITSGSCALSSCAMDELATFSDGAKKPDFPWIYTELDPDITAQRAYHIYEKGHCMYGVLASVVLQLAKEHGEPYRSFPVDMMRYGGGTAGWGSLFCIGSLHDVLGKTTAEPSELCDVTLLDGPFKKAQQIERQYILAHVPNRLLAPFLQEIGLAPRAPFYPDWWTSSLHQIFSRATDTIDTNVKMLPKAYTLSSP